MAPGTSGFLSVRRRFFLKSLLDFLDQHFKLTGFLKVIIRPQGKALLTGGG
jgi:hypothetical protein